MRKCKNGKSNQNDFVGHAVLLIFQCIDTIKYMLFKMRMNSIGNRNILILFPVNKFGRKCISTARVVDLPYLFTMILKFAIFEHAE